jgi:dTDP-4-dehydrorhamnose 3,5-epimerase
VTLTYLCSTTYNPSAEHTVHPLDPELGIDWPAEVPLLSARDDAAPSLAEAITAGTLPDLGACRAYASGLRTPENP